ncbi:hypothetical protein HY933_03380 [Candidatus Falkowbacteria bacterium]|nr:hypothetical protein [Candidatus Falkowbacteria bacterium]
MIDWSVLTSTHFWFSATPGPFLPLATKVLLALFILFILVGIVLQFIANAKRANRPLAHLLKKMQSLTVTMGFAGLFILFCFWQQIPYLSSRYWLAVWLLGAGVWKGFILKFMIVDMPRQRQAMLEQQKREQYLPKKKRK